MYCSYFLGAPSPDGFDTRFGDEIKAADFTYILKGGPGTGKSTFMKKIADDLSDLDTAELFYCSSDPDSLDAVRFPKLGVIFVDGTAPHVFDPQYPGARQQILNLGDGWSKEALYRNAFDIIRFSDENAALHQRARQYLGALCRLGDDTYILGSNVLNRSKLDAYSKRLSQKLFPKSDGSRGRISMRQITSVTPKGVITQESAFNGCMKFYIDDPCGTVTDLLLKNLSIKASEAGYSVIVSRNVRMSGCVYEHAVIPELSLAFVSGEYFAEPDVKKINALRFYDKDELRLKKDRLSFNQSLRKELTAELVKTLAEAKDVHDDLEKCYIGAMNFEYIESLRRDVVKYIRDNH